MTAAHAADKTPALPAAERDTERVRTVRLACRDTVQPLAVRRLQGVDESGTPRLIDAIKQALDTVTKVDIRGWCTHCGYPIH